MNNLQEIFKKHNINLNENQTNQFDLFFSYLVETNKFLNLTAITERKEVEIKHFLDSVLPEKLFPKNCKVVDVGSGAGFPAIPLKIVRPDLQISMVDSLNKRVNFLKEVVDMLDFQRGSICAVHARAEDFAKQNWQVFDVAVARAVAPLCTLVEYLLPLVKIGGYVIVYKSAKLKEEIDEAEKAIKVLGGSIEKIEKYAVEEMGTETMERNILVLRKVVSTPQKYPRSGNKPRLCPIK